MSEYYSAVLTDSGAALLAAAEMGEAQIEFTKLYTGDGEYTPAELLNLVRRTALKSEKQQFPFSTIKRTDPNTVLLRTPITNEDLETGYYVREVGVYAKNALDNSAPILYSIAVATTPDFLPAFDGITVTITQEIYLSVSGALELTIEASSGALVTIEDMEDAAGMLQQQVDAINENIEELSDNKQDKTDNALTTTAKTIVGAINEISSFNSDDTTLTPTAKVDIPLVESNESIPTFFNKITNMFKNTRYLLKMAGNTDISKIGDGTITGGLSYLSNQSHNVPRLTPKDITAYYTDGSLWDRLNGTNGYSLFEDIYAGDYIRMSRPISAYERTGQYQTTGSQYVTIAGINTLYGNGNTGSGIVSYNHLVMIPGQGFGGTQHFGRSRMNTSNSTANGYTSSEMFTATLGRPVSSGSTASTASISQQLYAEFGSHLKTTRELLTNSTNTSGYNRFGSNSGCSNNWTWTDCQAVLMSEVEVYGSVVWSSSGYDTGNAKQQLPLFRFSTQAQNNRSAYYWLKDIASAAHFCNASCDGLASCSSASGASNYVRPRFVIA